MTAVEWLIEELKKPYGDIYMNDILIKAKEMEKQQMQDFGARCCLLTKQKNEWTLEELYNDLYRSKGSGDASSQTEISDEEIQQGIADKWDGYVPSTWFSAFEEGAKWYREQLKKKQ